MRFWVCLAFVTIFYSAQIPFYCYVTWYETCTVFFLNSHLKCSFGCVILAHVAKIWAGTVDLLCLYFSHSLRLKFGRGQGYTIKHLPRTSLDLCTPLFHFKLLRQFIEVVEHHGKVD